MFSNIEKTSKKLRKTNFIIGILENSFKHRNFNWFLSSPGDSCDKTCQNVGLKNGASDAAESTKEGDCTVINNFLERGKTKISSKSNSSYWTFGYFYDSYNKYVCTSYGPYVSAGAGLGQNNSDPDRRVVCPCQKGIEYNTVIL